MMVQSTRYMIKALSDELKAKVRLLMHNLS